MARPLPQGRPRGKRRLGFLLTPYPDTSLTTELFERLARANLERQLCEAARSAAV